MHTNFKLKSGGEVLLLTSSNGQEIDRLLPPGLGDNYAFGRIPDGSDFLSDLYVSSPGISNNDNDGISYSHESGYYTSSFQLDLQTQNAGSVIHYTLDGSIPGPQSMVFSGPLTIEDRSALPNQFASINNSAYDFFNPSVSLFKGTILRMQVFQAGVPVSPVVTKSYFVHPEIFTKYTLPIVSLISAPENLFDPETGIYVPGVNLNSLNPIWTGNYFQRGSEWEREAVIQYFDTGGNLVLGQNIGLRIHGGKTRGRRQKSFRCYARKDYGAGAFQHRLISDKDKEEYKRFVLQSPIGGWNNTMIKDVVTHELCKGLDFDVQYAQPVILFLNGEYWGIYFIRDRYDEYYLKEEYGLDRDELDILVHGSGIRPDGDENWGTLLGDNDDYLALMQYMDQNDMSTSASYEHFKSQVNINGLLDYYCTQIYFNNKDWPRNNHEVWRTRDEGSPFSRWQWWLFDVDGGWGYLGSAHNMLAYATHPTGTAWQNPAYATFLLRKLLENPFFVQDFLERFACLMQNEFRADHVIDVIEEIRDWLVPEMQDQIDRWGYVTSLNAWDSSLENRLKNFARERRKFMVKHLQEAFDLEEFNLEDYCNPITSTAEELSVVEQAIIAPNPTRDRLSIRFPEQDLLVGEATLYDGLGQAILSTPYRGSFELSMQTLAAGTYTLVLRSETGQMVKRVVKLK